MTARLGYAAAAVVLWWLLMQAVHESGHVLGAAMTGGSIERVVLHPLTISRTDVSHDPQPRFTLWCGPVIGVLLPLAGWVAAVRCPWPLHHWLRGFAGFCLIANGLYLAYGSVDGIGDAGELQRHGVPTGMLWAFGAISVPSGLAIWHALGPRLGLGPESPPVRTRHAAAFWLSATIIIALECWLSPR